MRSVFISLGSNERATLIISSGHQNKSIVVRICFFLHFSFFSTQYELLHRINNHRAARCCPRKTETARDQAYGICRHVCFAGVCVQLNTMLPQDFAPSHPVEYTRARCTHKRQQQCTISFASNVMLSSMRSVVTKLLSGKHHKWIFSVKYVTILLFAK